MKPAANTPHDWSEDKLQAEFFRWFVNTFPELRGCLFSVPNGVNKGGMLQKLFKATGLWPGVADLLFMYKKTTYCLELKRPDGRGGQSPSQKKWQAQMERNGFDYTLFNDLEDLKGYICGLIVKHIELEIEEEEKIDPDNYPHEQLNLDL